MKTQKRKTPKLYDNAGPDNGPTPEFVDVKGIAQFLGCSKETIHRLLAKKKIPAHRVGKLWRFEIREVANWVKSDKAEM